MWNRRASRALAVQGLFVWTCVVGVAVGQAPPAAKPEAPVLPAPPESEKTTGPRLTLRGAQEVSVVQVLRADVPHTVVGEYRVGAGQALVVELGAKFECDAGSCIVIGKGGRVVMRGVPDFPILFQGKKKTPGYWKGIESNEAAETKLESVHVFDAAVGLNLKSGTANLAGCVLAFGNRGMAVDAHGHAVKMVGCLLAKNAEHGLNTHRSDIEVELCTFAENGGWGINCVYYGAVHLDHSVIVSNGAGGISVAMYENTTSAKKSVIMDNCDAKSGGEKQEGRFDVFNTSKSELDFSENFWGTRSGRPTKAAGRPTKAGNATHIWDGADNQNVGRVVVLKALESRPSACGAREVVLRGKKFAY